MGKQMQLDVGMVAQIEVIGPISDAMMGAIIKKVFTQEELSVIVEGVKETITKRIDHWCWMVRQDPNLSQLALTGQLDGIDKYLRDTMRYITDDILGVKSEPPKLQAPHNLRLVQP